MQPLTLIPKFDIIQAKCTYGFTQTPIIPMNPKLALATAFYYTFSEKPKLPIKPNDTPPKLNEPVLVNSKIIDTVMYYIQESESGSSFINRKMLCPFEMPYMKWYTYRVQHQLNLLTLSPMESSLSRLYNTDPKLRTFSDLCS